MKIIALKNAENYENAVSEAIKILRSGGSIVFPTDTVYGLGANACNRGAVEQIYKIKKRSITNPLPVLARNLEWVREIAFVPPKLEIFLNEIWPGPVTVILPSRKVTVSLTHDRNVGVRVAKHSLIGMLLAMFGYPLAATSANISGEPETGDPAQVIASFKEHLWRPDLLLDAGVLPPSKSSTVIDLTTIKPKILRVGPSSPEYFMKLLGLYDKKTHPKRN